MSQLRHAVIFLLNDKKVSGDPPTARAAAAYVDAILAEPSMSESPAAEVAGEPSPTQEPA